jgi:hypothetical protein
MIRQMGEKAPNDRNGRTTRSGSGWEMIRKWAKDVSYMRDVRPSEHSDAPFGLAAVCQGCCCQVRSSAAALTAAI